MFNFWWSVEWSEQKTLTEMQKNEKGPLSYWKMKCSYLDYIQLLMIGQAIWAKHVNRNVKKQKRPPKLSKEKMFIFGLCSLLMISWVIQAKNVDRNAIKWKSPPKSSKNKMFILGLCSTSDDQPSNPSYKNVDQNTKKMKKAP